MFRASRVVGSTAVEPRKASMFAMERIASHNSSVRRKNQTSSTKKRKKPHDPDETLLDKKISQFLHTAHKHHERPHPSRSHPKLSPTHEALLHYIAANKNIAARLPLLQDATALTRDVTGAQLVQAKPQRHQQHHRTGPRLPPPTPPATAAGIQQRVEKRRLGPSSLLSGRPASSRLGFRRGRTILPHVLASSSTSITVRGVGGIPSPGRRRRRRRPRVAPANRHGLDLVDVNHVALGDEHAERTGRREHDVLASATATAPPVRRWCRRTVRSLRIRSPRYPCRVFCGAWIGRAFPRCFLVGCNRVTGATSSARVLRGVCGRREPVRRTFRRFLGR